VGKAGGRPVLPTDKATCDRCDPSLDLVKNECRPLAGESVGGLGDVVTATLGVAIRISLDLWEHRRIHV
jgi:hypothetical protein